MKKRLRLMFSLDASRICLERSLLMKFNVFQAGVRLQKDFYIEHAEAKILECITIDSTATANFINKRSKSKWLCFFRRNFKA